MKASFRHGCITLADATWAVLRHHAAALSPLVASEFGGLYLRSREMTLDFRSSICLFMSWFFLSFGLINQSGSFFRCASNELVTRQMLLSGAPVICSHCYPTTFLIC